MDYVLYTREGCQDTEVMRDYLSSLGIDCRLRPVDGDPGARREWEDLDGEVTPLLVIDQRRIVRGLDRARVDQLVGWIGC
jgi:glutaredoxin